MWPALRRVLVAKGLNPETSILEAMPSGPESVDGVQLDSYSCILVTEDRRVFVFKWGVTWEQPPEEWIAYRWQEKTESWKEQRWVAAQVLWAYSQFDAADA